MIVFFVFDVEYCQIRVFEYWVCDFWLMGVWFGFSFC